MPFYGHCSYALMQQCWKEKPDERPTFEQIKTYLEDNLAAEPRKKHREQRQNNETANSKPTEAKAGSMAKNRQENIAMKDVVPESPRPQNDYLLLLHSFSVDEYVPPSKQ